MHAPYPVRSRELNGLRVAAAALSSTAGSVTVAVAFALCCAFVAAAPPDDPMPSPGPDAPRAQGVTPYPEMVERLASWEQQSPLVSVSTLGTSVGGHRIPVVRIGNDGTDAAWRVLFVGQQHGDEIAGKEALLELLGSVADGRRRLPNDVLLWVVPMLNPDGAIAGARRNGADADLNRDHLLLEQPETRALHRLLRRVRPHVFVDCHEFTRDTEDYSEAGLGEWPLIMMDAANHPLIPGALRRAALDWDWVERAVPRLRELGFPYRRYTVGGVPPNQEQRFSTLEGDDARNAAGLHGALSFIIESGVRRAAEDPDADLGRRVEAYLELLWPFLIDESTRDRDRAAVRLARRLPLPRFLPANAFWGSVLDEPFPVLGGPVVHQYPVTRDADATTEWVHTPHMMTTVVIKRSEPTPSAYAVPAPFAEPFARLLDRHEVPYEVTESPRRLTAEACRLVRFEPELDEVYQRYGGRQIVRRQQAGEQTLPAASLIVTPTPPWARRAVVLLEPTQLYGLYAEQRYRDLVADDGTIPVLRIP